MQYISDKIIAEGIFGVDDNIENYINGTISINENNHIILTLLNSLSPDISGTFNEISKLIEKPLIKGYGRNGKYYELINCVSSGGTVTFVGIIQPKVYYSCDYIIEYPSLEIKEKEVNKVSVFIDKLNQWCNIEESWKLKSYQDPFELIFSYKTLWEATNGDEIISISNGFKTQAEPNINFGVNYSYSIGIQFPLRKISTELIKEYQFRIWDFITLLTLLTNERLHINKMLFITPDKTHIIRIYNSIFQEETDKKIDTYKLVSMIGLKDIKNNLLDIYKTYIDKKEKLKGSINLIYKIAEYKKNRRIDIVDYTKQTASAIECFMRNSRNILIEENEKNFEKRIERILKCQTEEDKKWLQTQLKYSNQATFRKQIKKLFDEIKNKYSEVSKGILDNKKMREDLIERFVSTRNFYTHYDLESKGKMLGTWTQIFLCDYINESLRILILEDLGVDHAILEKKSKNNQDLIRSKEGLLKHYLDEK